MKSKIAALAVSAAFGLPLAAAQPAREKQARQVAAKILDVLAK